jgi:hypothetical protein
MIYAVARLLSASLKSSHVPYPVSYVFGDEPTSSVMAARERIVIVEPRGQKGNRILPPRGTHHNPQHYARANDLALVRIFARNNVTGATDQEHVRLAKRVRDHVVSHLERIVRLRKNMIEWGPGGFVNIADAAGSSVWSGAVYEQEFSIEAGIEFRTWEGDAREEVEIGSDVDVVHTTMVSDELGPAGTPPGDAEQAC